YNRNFLYRNFLYKLIDIFYLVIKAKIIRLLITTLSLIPSIILAAPQLYNSKHKFINEEIKKHYLKFSTFTYPGLYHDKLKNDLPD
ncbi:hypothetical protein NAI34_09575, partial [Francisella tularensis subsp. holarctica]|nr:hypothetical protein [Francisella tularensis subsp. holarctica]